MIYLYYPILNGAYKPTNITGGAPPCTKTSHFSTHPGAPCATSRTLGREMGTRCSFGGQRFHAKSLELFNHRKTIGKTIGNMVIYPRKLVIEWDL